MKLLERRYRIAGNLYQLGNVYSSLRSGESTLAARMPLLTRMDDGRYTISIKLHAGNDLVYKYTLGDSLVNAERDEEQNLVLGGSSSRIKTPNHSL